MKKVLLYLIIVITAFMLVACKKDEIEQLEVTLKESSGDEINTCPFNEQYIRVDGYVDGAIYPNVTVINNLDELNKYYEENKEIHDLERRNEVYTDTTIGFLDACDKYDEKYFSGDKSLILIGLEEGSGSIRHEVTEVSKQARRMFTSGH